MGATTGEAMVVEVAAVDSRMPRSFNQKVDSYSVNQLSPPFFLKKKEHHKMTERSILLTAAPLLLVFAIAGCNRSETEPTQTASSELILEMTTLVHAAPCTTAEKMREVEFVGFSFRGESNIYIANQQEFTENKPTAFLQTVETPDFYLTGVAMGSVPASAAPPNAPVLYAYGMNAVTEGYEFRMYARGNGEPVNERTYQTLSLPEAPVAMGQSDPSLIWLATEDDNGQVSVYRLLDINRDGWMDRVRSFATFSQFASRASSVLSRLKAGPFVLKHASNQEVLFVQDRFVRLRVLDRNQDGSGDVALLPAMRNRTGSFFAGGIRSGSERVGILGPPRQTVEVWSIDERGHLASILGSGITDLSGHAVLDLARSLRIGDSISMQNIGSSRTFESDRATVSALPRLDVLRLSEDRVEAGGTIDFAVEYAMERSFNEDEPEVTASWIYRDRENWGEFRTVPCSLTRLDAESYRVHIPEVRNHWGGRQVLTFCVGDLQRAVKVRIRSHKEAGSIEING